MYCSHVCKSMSPLSDHNAVYYFNIMSKATAKGQCIVLSPLTSQIDTIINPRVTHTRRACTPCSNNAYHRLCIYSQVFSLHSAENQAYNSSAFQQVSPLRTPTQWLTFLIGKNPFPGQLSGFPSQVVASMAVTCMVICSALPGLTTCSANGLPTCSPSALIKPDVLACCCPPYPAQPHTHSMRPALSSLPSYDHISVEEEQFHTKEEQHWAGQ